jgi:predicted nuclease with TOPRIM domain
LGEAEKQKLLTQIGTLTAQVLAAEEAVKYRDEEVKDLKEENHRLTEEVNSTIPVLKAQTRYHRLTEEVNSTIHVLQAQVRYENLRILESDLISVTWKPHDIIFNTQ